MQFFTRLFACTLLLQLPFLIRAQDNFILSNFNKNILLINPAFMGMDQSTTFNVFGRKQWAGIDDAPAAFSFTGNTSFEKSGMAAGLAIEHRKAAVTSFSSAGLLLSKSVAISNKVSLDLGFYGGADNFKTDYAGIGEGDPVFAGKQSLNLWRTVVGFGLMAHSEKFYAGFSMPRIKLKKFDDREENLRYNDRGNSGYVTAGALFSIDEELALTPSILFNLTQEDKPLDLGLMLQVREKAGIGATWRSTGELNAALQLNFTRSLQFGYSYIFGVGSSSQYISRYSKGSHEVFLNFRLPSTKGHTLPFKWW